MLRLIFLVFVFSNILLINCSKENHKFTSQFSGLEYHRQLALEEMRVKFPWIDSLYYSVQYEIPDSISPSDSRLKYVNENKNLPKFIIRALFEKHNAPLMTINEWFLSHPDELRELRAGIISISIPQEYSDKLYIGYTKYLNKKHGLFSGGSYWGFKYGFFWEAGTI